MKLRVKILLIVSILIFAAALILLVGLFKSDPLMRKTASLPEVNGEQLFAELETPEQVHYPRLTSHPAAPEQAVDRRGLAGAIRQTGGEMVKALLPPDTVVTLDSELELLSGDCALLTGSAAVPAQQDHGESYYRFTVKVYFLPNGSCQADFPEFKAVTPK